jgi:hypothetical protein
VLTGINTMHKIKFNQYIGSIEFASNGYPLDHELCGKMYIKIDLKGKFNVFDSYGGIKHDKK